MIVCPNCNHQNPDGAIQCEACYTPLPAMLECPACGASVQSDASFCGQCGNSLNPDAAPMSASDPASDPSLSDASDAELEGFASIDLDADAPDLAVPDLAEFDPLIEPEPLIMSTPGLHEGSLNASEPDLETHPLPPTVHKEGGTPPTSPPMPAFNPTQIQTQTIRLIHTHSNTPLELPQHLSVIHVGKPNDRIPPDLDVSGFPDSEVVSRVHADIRIEGDSYFIEDVGSSNGTYINNVPLSPGNRHRLRTGDRVALGKGDKVSFIVQIS